MPSSVSDENVEQRIVEASVVVPAGMAITGWADLRWRGGRWFSGRNAVGDRLPVTIAVGTHDIRPQPGIEVSGEGLNRSLVQWLEGVPVTDARYAVSYLMRYATSMRRAVVVLEMAAYSDLVSVQEQIDYMTPGQNGWTGVPRSREAAGLAQENSWSPQETFMGLTWEVDTGRRRPLCNAPVFDLNGRHIGTPDVIDPETGVIGEYDGDGHLERPQRDKDLRREGLFRRHGLEPVVMIAPDVRDPSAFIDRLETAYRSADARSGAPRTWTLDQPSWWIPTQTVEQRRNLTVSQRARLLAHRAA